MKKYRDEIRRIMIAVNVIDGAYEMIARKTGIKENTLALFYALDDGKSHSQKEICEEWMIPKTTLNTIVKECIKNGYIILNTDHHKKEKEICLTERGQEYAKEILDQVYHLEEAAMEHTLQMASPEFIQTLEAFTAHLKEEAGNFTHES